MHDLGQATNKSGLYHEEKFSKRPLKYAGYPAIKEEKMLVKQNMIALLGK